MKLENEAFITCLHLEMCHFFLYIFYILLRNLKMEMKTGQIPHCGPVPSKAKQDSKCIKGGRYTLLFCKIRLVDL